jgi:hypothetical protein
MITAAELEEDETCGLSEGIILSPAAHTAAPVSFIVPEDQAPMGSELPFSLQLMTL